MKYLLTLLLIYSSFCISQAQDNILLLNKNLINQISKYDVIYEINEKFIKFQLDSTYKINFGFGVAWKDSGRMIYAANVETAYNIANYGDYIVLAKGEHLGDIKYGLIDTSGNIVLDFKYDRIGEVLVPLPDNIITVQIEDKFGIFNLDTKKLSEIKYDNSGGWLNDGYSYYEGGMGEAQSKIYNQLDLSSFGTITVKPHSDSYESQVIIQEEDTISYLVNKEGQKISKQYKFINKLYGFKEQTYYVGAIQLNPHKYRLLNEKGIEIAEIYSYLPDYNSYYIKLDATHYFFVENQNIVTIPTDLLKLYNDVYAKEGFLAFKDRKGNKYFVDKYGNAMNK